LRPPTAEMLFCLVWRARWPGTGFDSLLLFVDKTGNQYV
jgi:hypothetical protein